MFLVFLGKIVSGDNRDCKTKEATALAKAPLLLEILGRLTRVATCALLVKESLRNRPKRKLEDYFPRA